MSSGADQDRDRERDEASWPWRLLLWTIDDDATPSGRWSLAGALFIRQDWQKQKRPN